MNINERVAFYVDAAAKRLMPDIEHELGINVKFVQDGVFDAWVEVDDHDFGEPNPRDFNIYVRAELKEDEETLMKTLCHEMVHVKQFAYNELEEGGPGRVVYAGEDYYYSDSVAEYYNRPWEIEAYGLENAIYFTIAEIEKLNDLMS